MAAILKTEKSLWRNCFAVSGPVWMKFGGQMLNHVEKQQNNIIVKKLAVYNAF